MTDETCERIEAIKAAVAQEYGDPSMSGLKKEPQNNRKQWHTSDSNWYSFQKKPQLVERARPRWDE
jgi:hypothetical protein